MRGLVLLCASQRWRDNNQSEARLSSGRQWPGLMAGTPEWHPVTWSYTLVTNKHCHCHSTHYLSYTPTHLSTFQTYRHIRSDSDYNTTNSKSITISFIRAYPSVGIHYLCQNIFGFIQIVCESNCRMMFHSACYDMMRDAMCQIVRYSQLMTVLTRLPWTLTWTLPHICGLWPSDDNTRMWNTKNYARLVSIFCFLCQGDVPMVLIWVRHCACKCCGRGGPEVSPAWRSEDNTPAL